MSFTLHVIMAQAYTTPSIRLFTEMPLHAGAGFDIEDKQAHYLQQVMRVKEGSQIALFNGADGEWLGEITQIRKKSVTVSVRQLLREQLSSPDLWLVFAPIKHGRIDYMVEKATELGVSMLQPVLTQHTIASRVNTDRLLAHAIEAAEQCSRLDVPRMCEPKTFEQLMGGWPKERGLIYGDETGQGPSAREVLSMKKPGPYAILIGPEGGFSLNEHQILRKLPFAAAISMGPRVMRADTAALAALVCAQLWLGDWEKKPRFYSAE